ncbi:hypothetical protein [Geminisphaera colitermitum]|nr:hypothetical protein [Geminisphaera colitermitum]
MKRAQCVLRVCGVRRFIAALDGAIYRDALRRGGGGGGGAGR